jgi:hypothetical protein
VVVSDLTSAGAEEPGGHVVLGGTYVLGEIVGTGGTYTVYETTRLQRPGTDAAPEATDEPSVVEPPLLVKVLHPHLIDDDHARASLAREVAASEQLDHPGVSKVLDSGEDEVAGATVPWIVTRRLPGTLLSEVAAGDGLPWPDALAVVAGLLEALTAVHAAGLVHRDVGPRNVVVDRRDDGTWSVGLLDLGLTAPAGGDGDGEQVNGSAAYMSPEQAQGRPLDARSDLYSVGALAYFALTGHAPYVRPTPADVLRAHVEAPVPAPSARRAAVPVAVDRFVARAMAKNPVRRFASADAMGSSLAGLLGASWLPAAVQTAGDATQALDQVDDPDRTAVVGVGAAAAAATAALADDQAEMGRTRQLGPAVADLPDEAGADPGEDPGAPEDEDRRGFFARPWGIALLVVLGLLVAGGLAFALWPSDDTTEAPAPAVSSSPSPSPTRSASPTPSVAPVLPDEPESRPTPTPTPTRTPSASPTPSATPTPSQEPSSAPEPTATQTEEPDPAPEPEPTETETTEPEPEPEPTETETTEPEPEPTEAAPSDPAPAPSGDAAVGDPSPAP